MSHTKHLAQKIKNNNFICIYFQDLVVVNEFLLVEGKKKSNQIF